METMWLIYSLEHRAWWGSASHGYVFHREDAERYTYEEAKGIVEGANQHLSGEVPNEAMCPAY